MDFLYELGRAIANFQALESGLKRFIALLLDSSDLDPGRITASELSYRAKVAVLRALYDYRVSDKERTTRMRALLGRIAGFEDERNRFMHSSYSGYGEEKIFRHKENSTLSAGFTRLKLETSHEELAEFSQRLLSEREVLIEAYNDYLNFEYWELKEGRPRLKNIQVITEKKDNRKKPRKTN